MNRYLGIDFGLKKIGVSISDPLKIIAQDYCVIEINDESSHFYELINIIKKNNVEKIILGLPINMDGTEGIQAYETREFGNELIKKMKHNNLCVKIIFNDERLSTKRAKEIMHTLDIKDAKKNGLDSKSASVILQDFLDYNIN